jgi:hypothetical protein
MTLLSEKPTTTGDFIVDEKNRAVLLKLGQVSVKALHFQ